MRAIIRGLVIAVISTGSVFAQSKLIGRVTDVGGTPLSAVMVSISGQAATQAAFSNAEGYYVILGVPSGDYTIKTVKKGLPSWKNQINLASGATKRMDIQIGSDSEEKPVIATVKKKEEKPVEAKVEKPVEKNPTTETPKPTTETKPTADEIALQKAQEEAARLAQEASELAEAATQVTEAEVVGGIKTVYQKLQYPEMARRQKMNGHVVAKVYLDKDGNVSKIELLKTAQEVFNDEVFRTLTEEVAYKPATMGGKPVPSALVIPVKFELK